MISNKNLDVLSRILMSSMFGLSVFRNLTGHFTNSVKYVKSINFPLPLLSVIMGMIIKTLGVYSLLTKKYVKYILPILIAFTILVTILFNNPIQYPDKFWMFFSLLGVIGGLINFYKNFK